MLEKIDNVVRREKRQQCLLFLSLLDFFNQFFLAGMKDSHVKELPLKLSLLVRKIPKLLLKISIVSLFLYLDSHYHVQRLVDLKGNLSKTETDRKKIPKQVSLC